MIKTVFKTYDEYHRIMVDLRCWLMAQSPKDMKEFKRSDCDFELYFLDILEFYRKIDPRIEVLYEYSDQKHSHKQNKGISIDVNIDQFEAWMGLSSMGLGRTG